ncbi:MAG TPA: hypothetical protein VLA24_17875 [Pseudomonadales bacterium]|nr:hypothetical protein [Pseudomonadales bacterium]
MNIERWAERQRAALIDAGVHPLDAEIAVQWVIDNLPPGEDPDIWIPARRVIDNAIDDAGIMDSKAYWLGHENVPSRYRMLLSATPVEDEDHGRDIRDDATIALLLYLFLRNRNQYYTQKPFRPVAQRNVRNLLDALVNAEERAVSDLITALHNGDIAPAVWQRHMETQLRRLHLNYRSLGNGGYANMSQAEMVRINDILRSEYTRLGNFVRDITGGRSSLAQSQVRGQMYVGTARVNYWEATEAQWVAPEDMTTIERRMLTPADHCVDCLGYADRGWSYLGSLPYPGNGSICLSNCKCYKLYRNVPSAELSLWIGTGRASA